MSASLRARLAKLEMIVRQPKKPVREFTPQERAIETTKYLNMAAHKHGLLDRFTATFDLVALAAKDKVAELILRAKNRRDSQAAKE